MLPQQDQINKLQQDQTIATSGNVGRTPGGFVNTITGEMLAPTSSIDYKTPAIPPPESIANLTVSAPQIPLTPQETQADELTKKIMDVNNSILGKAAFTQEKRNEFGISEKEQTIQDLTTQFNDLKNKEAVIRTEFGGSLAQNKGVLEPFVTGERDARLRQNAVQALTLSSTIDAANGLLASAQRKVDLAVAQKYAPLEEELKIKKENLDILSKSPELTRAEKDRANARAINLKNQELLIEQKKQEQKDIWNTSVTAAQNMQSFRPTVQYTTSAQAIQAIQVAKTKEEALKIATDTGLTKQPTAQSDFEQAFRRDNGRAPTTQELLAFHQKIAEAGRAPISPEEQQKRNQIPAQQKLGGWLQSKAGTDRFVAPQDYLKAKAAWVQDGFAGDEFDKIYSGYVNPSRATEYGVNFQSKTKAPQ